MRKQIEERERKFLSPFATLSSKTAGRKHEEKECPFRTAFQKDRDKIIHSKAFRRLKHKTQVFLSPAEDHYRTRLTHTIEVAQIARTISRALGLNEDLTEAIAMGHDLGHTPFGHGGEDVLCEIVKQHGKTFRHNEQSVRVVEVLEKDGKGLNLCAEVIDGILYHPQKVEWPHTLEGVVVRYADHFAYIRHDIEDALRAGVLKEKDLPKKHMKVLGPKILDVVVSDIIKMSRGKDKVKLSKNVQYAVDGLYDFLYKNVYTNMLAKKEETKIPILLRLLFRFYHYNADFQKGIKDSDHQLQHTIDFIAGMSDRFAINKFQDLFVPNEWRTV
ncbi:MAG: deoxyguanosinetriphosphate triphosphohydrolase [Candidatus Margulisiibacteriota bacterium]